MNAVVLLLAIGVTWFVLRRKPFDGQAVSSEWVREQIAARGKRQQP